MTKKTKPQFLTDYSKNEKWDYHKDNSDVVSYFYQTSQNHQKYGDRVHQCADLLRFKFIDSDDGESKLKLYKTNFCRVRLCPVCQWRRSMAWQARMFQNLPYLLEEHSNLRFIFLTLTVRNCAIEGLSETLKAMNGAWNKLRIRKEFQKACKGFIRATEVTKSGNEAHPHFHCIIAVNQSYFTDKTYIKTEKWAELWQSCLGVDYLPVVDARKIRQKGDTIDPKAINETLKYTVKIEDLVQDKDWFLILTDQLYKKRFLATGGVFKEILKEDVSEQEMITTKDQEDETEEDKKSELWFDFSHYYRKYKNIKNPYE